MVELGLLRSGGRVIAEFRRRLWIVFCLALAVTGCRSSGVTLQSARQAFAHGDLATAKQSLQRISEGKGNHREVSELDLAIVELASGDPQSAEQRLRRLRDHFDAQPEVDAPRETLSLAADDNLRSFRISDHEQVLLRSLLAVCSLTDDGTDAEAYLLQAQATQEALLRQHGDPSRRFQPIAFAPYLRGTLREATHQDYDDASRAFRLVGSIAPDFAPAEHDIRRVENGAHSAPGHGVLYVIAFVGRGPQLVQSVAPTTTTSLQIASTLLRSQTRQADDSDDTAAVLPNVAEVKVPKVVVPPSELEAIGVAVDNKLIGATQTLTDLGQLAMDRLQAEMPWIIARAVARRVLKESSVTAAANSLGLKGDAKTAFEFVAMNAWSGTEKADTRCWGLLPREIQVMRLELPTGVQTIDLLPLSAPGAMTGAPNALTGGPNALTGGPNALTGGPNALTGRPRPHTVTIEDGRSHYAIVFAPEQILSVVPSR
jgi:hypothetical protein